VSRIVYPFPNGASRMNPDEIRAWAREVYGVEPVCGFSEIVAARAQELRGRVASYFNIGDSAAWYLQLSSGGEIAWQTEDVPEQVRADYVAFIFPVGFGNGAPVPQPSGQFDLFLNEKKLLSFRVVKHHQLWRKGDVSLQFSANRIESAPPNCPMYLDSMLASEMFAAFGPAILKVPASMLTPGERATLKVVPVADVQSTRWFQLVGNTEWEMFSDIQTGLAKMHSIHPKTASGSNVYFGDIHTHSGEIQDKADIGCGLKSRRENYEYAVGPAGLDIYALTDHEWQITKAGQDEYFNYAQEYNQPGRFVTLNAFEHTGTQYGHRNVYFRGEKAKVFPAHRDWNIDYWSKEVAVSPDELWAALDEFGARAITVPHHPSSTPHPLTWDFYNPGYDRLAEIYSCWGSSDYYGDYPRGVHDRYRDHFISDALRRGYRMGLIASSDGHDGHPGNAQSPLTKHHHMFHPLGSGWIGVLAERLERETVFDAMYARRCFATTGVPIVLDFTVNSHPMGSELPMQKVSRARELKILCAGSNGIDHVRILKNSRVVETVGCHGRWDCDIEWKDTDFDNQTPVFYHVRVVQVDGESAWSSPVWIG